MNGAEMLGYFRGMTVYVDTREQPTPKSELRYRAMGVPYERHKLDFGDYTAVFRCDGKQVSLENKVVIERKMGLEELSSCFCQERDRFEREFIRAKEAGAKMYLLVENSSIDSILTHKYRTQMSPNSFIASLDAWMVRYQTQVIFCSSLYSGKIIADILKKEGEKFMTGIDIPTDKG